MPEEPVGNKPRKRRGRGPMTDVSAVLSQVIAKFGLEQRMKEHAFMSLWGDIVDEPFKKVSRPLFIDYEGNLVVSVKDGSVAQELSFQRGQMMKKLAPFARGVGLRISGIRFDLKHFKEAEETDALNQALASHRQAAALNNTALPDNEALQQVVLPEEDLKELDKLKTGLRAGELDGEYESGTYERIVRLYERELRLRVWREQQGLAACSQCGFVDTRIYGASALCRLCHVKNLISKNS